ncbi:MAG: sarcosine oxidase subunit gamma [Pseudomonadota bacterium]
MAETSLKAKSPLNGYRKTLGKTKLEEVSGLSIVSLAIPQRGKTKLSDALKTAFGVAVPAPGKTLTMTSESGLLIGLQSDLVFALFMKDMPDPVGFIGGKIGDTAYLTRQSDGWCALRLSGPLTFAALERLSQVDLSPQSFPVGAVARTAMEHLNVIAIREDNETFLLLSASSSAPSFLHAVETSVRNVL